MNLWPLLAALPCCITCGLDWSRRSDRNCFGLAGGHCWCCDRGVVSFLLQSLLAAAFLLFFLLSNSCRIYTAVVDGDIASSVGDCLLLLLLCGECVAWGVSTALSVALIFFAFCAGSVWHGVCPLLSLSH